jgi:putative spermidine/putrescine transport system substrate-binding protein
MHSSPDERTLLAESFEASPIPSKEEPMSDNTSQAMERLLAGIRTRKLGRRAAMRRGLVLGLGTSVATSVLASQVSGQVASPAAEPPAEPVTLTIIDVAGQAQLTQSMIDDYVENHPEWVSNIEFTQATAPELSARIIAQQNAGRSDISMVLTGSDGLSAGIEQDLWLQLLPEFQSLLPNLDEILINPGAQDLAEGFGVNVVFGNYGPTFTYNPEMVETPPTTTDELLAWAGENDGQLMYARPANSGPGRSWLQALPYFLSDSDPKDPDTWDNTWSYLEELGQYIEYYPSGTTPTMQELGEGSRAMVASTMGWDMNPRVLGTVPMDFQAITFPDQPLLADSQYVTVPRGLDDDTTATVLNLISWMMQPDQQAKAYDQAYFYPGPAVKDVTLDMAPEESQQAVNSVRRPEFDEIIASSEVELPLDAPSLVRAFEIWDERIGSGKVN